MDECPKCGSDRLAVHDVKTDAKPVTCLECHRTFLHGEETFASRRCQQSRGASMDTTMRHSRDRQMREDAKRENR